MYLFEKKMEKIKIHDFFIRNINNDLNQFDLITGNTTQETERRNIL